MYLDRIINSAVPTAEETFACPNKHILGVRVIWEKERRPAFRLFVDAVTKKVCKAA
jgi:hypothetical protein